MTQSLEGPGTDEAPDYSSLYRARGDQVVAERPVFTGDVFFGVTVEGEDVAKNVVILQHPCAIRRGVELSPKLLVADVAASAVLVPSKWATGHYRQMPLVDLRPETDTKHYAAIFDNHHLVRRTCLDPDARVATLSQVGVNLLMQRWVHHNSRVIVPTHNYQSATSAQFDEADIIEEWCIDRVEDGVSLDESALEIDTWLTGDHSPSAPRARLNDPQLRSAVRRDVRDYLRTLRS